VPEDEPLRPTRALRAYAESPVIRAAIASIPVIGGPIDAFFGTWGSDVIQHRYDAVLEELRHEAGRLDENKVDRQFLESEEFFDLFAHVLQESARTRHREKIRLYARILAGRASIDWPEVADAEEILEILSGLSLRQVGIMVRLWNRAYGRAILDAATPEGLETAFDYQRLESMGLLSQEGLSLDHPQRLGGGYRMTESFQTIMSVVGAIDENSG
jgi:hypothetical protein